MLFFFFEWGRAYNLRQFSGNDGLSNSAILSMCQDRSGLLWLGSCDGLNLFDGLHFRAYKADKEGAALSGNLIESILEAGDDVLWIQTNYGLDRLDRQRDVLRAYHDFKGKNWLVKDRNGRVFVVKNDNFIYCYVPEKEDFLPVPVEGLSFEDILSIHVDEENVWWAFMRNNRYLRFTLAPESGQSMRLQALELLEDRDGIRWSFYDEGLFYLVDHSYALYEFDPLTQKKSYIYDLSAEVDRHGDISSLIRYKGDYFIGFKNKGLSILRQTPERKERFSIYETDIKAGIFCLMKDRSQDVVWVGTDGQGVFLFYNDVCRIRTTLSRDLPFHINTPVRTLFLDDNNTLWIGTKGDGIVRIHDYDIASGAGKTFDRLQTDNSLLLDNSVYTIVPGNRKRIVWIGSEKGLNYYLYKEKRIAPVALSANGKPVQFVHSVCEMNDSTLWIATVGGGIVKACIGWEQDQPAVKETKSFVFDNGRFASNYFFTTYKENDSIVWFGNRGYGAYRINSLTDEIEVFTFDRDNRNQTLNDIFSILKDDNGYWFGTSYGLARMSGDGEIQTFGQSAGFPNNAIHGMLEDWRGNLWLSTNQGLIQFNVLKNTFRTYRQNNELGVAEFSDGAYFRHERTGALFFGGVNGFVSVIANEPQQKDFRPEIQFARLSIFGKERHLFDFLRTNHGQKTLELDYKQNFFSLAFSAIDYVYGSDYTYFYKLEGASDHWIDNGASGSASFTNMAPGNYTLLVKYRNNITGNESDTQSLPIRILPPWHQTAPAYFGYAVLALLLLLLIARLSVKWYRMKKESMIEKLNRRQREEVYESKLRFFTNITHELCTPLTLIAGPCEKILAHEKADSHIRKYASLIQYNAGKLNALISELIEFRRLETGNRKPVIRPLSVSRLIREIAGSFCELADEKGINYRIRIEENILWNSDEACLGKIATNLLSNAFKYAPEKGEIVIELFVNDGSLRLIVTNTGKGIKAEDLKKVFDRYTILDNFEGKDNAPSRNGLGLAICSSMVALLDGQIKASSIPGETTTFSVALPALTVENQHKEESPPFKEESPLPGSESPSSPVDPAVSPPRDRNKQTMMIVDDDPDMLWFVSDIFAGKYNVVPVNHPEEVMPRLLQSPPDIILSDIMMPGLDGVSLTKAIKADKLLSHIPIILLSAKNRTEEQVQGIDAGAELYITKPFNTEYLEKMVERLTRREKDMKQYYASALSFFEWNEGKIANKEDRELLARVFRTIEEQIADPSLSVETLSHHLGCSSRQLYRKLKEVTSKTPAELIREYRMQWVERLLLASNLTIEEIICKAGFANRGSFFRMFAEKYGMTPKKYRDERRKDVNIK